MRSGFSEKSGSRQSLRGATAVRPLTLREVALRELLLCDPVWQKMSMSVACSPHISICFV
jgi:hypothetical protein